ncbi:MAG: hypothetical protein PHZ13_06360 [bacterium]|nr:hypothetical protein [bacterium]
MQAEDPIDELIKREKATEPNPFLASRVMAEIERRSEKKTREIALWQTVALAGSIAAMAFLGISIGSSYNERTTSGMSLNINDGEIENLGYYNITEYEQNDYH